MDRKKVAVLSGTPLGSMFVKHLPDCLLVWYLENVAFRICISKFQIIWVKVYLKLVHQALGDRGAERSNGSSSACERAELLGHSE